MRLTVGPHPAAVYWRRRGVVLVAVAMVVLVISYACSGTGTSNAGPGAQPTRSATGSPSVTTTLLHPTTRTPSPTATPFTLPTSGQTGPCGDGEMDLVAESATADAQRGQTVNFTIKIKNVSKRTCSRDIGADMQELRLLEGSSVMWSSDDCGANHGHDLRSFAPGREVSFTLTWQGRRSRSGTGGKICTDAAPFPTAQVYQLVARLDQKLSVPVDLQIHS